MRRPKLAFWLGPEVEEKLEKFGDEAKVKPVRSKTYPSPSIRGAVIRQFTIAVNFRGLYLDCFATFLLKKRAGWLAVFLSMKGSVGLTACTILYFSKILGGKPKIIYMDRDTRTGETEINAEWYRGDVDLDWRMEMHRTLGYETKGVIKFRDIVEEAMKFLDEWY